VEHGICNTADFFGGKGRRGGAILTPNELIVTFGGLHLCVQLRENQQRNATVRVTTHGQPDRQTDANRFYYMSHAICYSYGADEDQKQILTVNLYCITTDKGYCLRHHHYS